MAASLVVLLSVGAMLVAELRADRTVNLYAFGKLFALGTLLLGALPLVLRGAHHARGGAREGAAGWVLDMTLVVVAALVLLFFLGAPPVTIEECGINGELCTKGRNFSPPQPDGPIDDSPPPSTPPLTR